MALISLAKAEEILKQCTFKIRIEFAQGLWWWGTGFFVSKDGWALTAYHNLPEAMRESRKGLVQAYYDGRWITQELVYDLSSEILDVAVLRIVNLAGISIQAVPLGCPKLAAPLERRQEFWAGRPVCVYGFPCHRYGQVDRLVDGVIRSSQPIAKTEETDNEGNIVRRIERLCFSATRGEDLTGISGAPMLDRESGCIAAVEGSYEGWAGWVFCTDLDSFFQEQGGLSVPIHFRNLRLEELGSQTFFTAEDRRSIGFFIEYLANMEKEGKILSLEVRLRVRGAQSRRSSDADFEEPPP